MGKIFKNSIFYYFHNISIIIAHLESVRQVIYWTDAVGTSMLPYTYAHTRMNYPFSM